MPTVVITDESGQLTVSIDGQEQPVASVDEACQAVEMAFGLADEVGLGEDAAMMAAQKGYGDKPRMSGRPSVGQVFGD